MPLSKIITAIFFFAGLTLLGHYGVASGDEKRAGKLGR